MIKAIIFDIGGVMIPDIQKLIIKEIKNKKFTGEFEKYAKDLDSGKVTLSELEKKFKHKYNQNINLRKIFIKKAQEHGLNKKVRQIVLKLKKKYKLYYLSNTIKEHYLVRKKQHVYDLFIFGIDSYKVKLRKPNPRIYKLLLRKIKLKPEECLFIDDRKKNIKGAKRLKIKAIRYTNPKKLMKDLR